MRKLSLLLICFLTLPFFLYSLEEWELDPPDEINPPAPVEEKKAKKVKEPPARKELRIPDRAFELGLNVDVGLSNNFLAYDEIFQEVLVIDLDRLTDGLKANFGIGLTPIYLKIASKKGWGFGLYTGVDVVGIFGLSGDMLSFKKADDSKSELSGAIFASAGINIFFPVHKFKVKVRPAAYYTVAYMKPDISYGYSSDSQGTQLYIDFDLKIFTAFPMEKFPDSFSDGFSDSFFDDFKLTAEPGFDLSVGLEYPLFNGLDLGIDLYNIPIYSSTVKNYLQMNTTLGSKNSVSLEELFSSFENGDISPIYGEGNEKIDRPFKTLAWASWRPFFASHIFSIIPTFGFSVSQLYLEPFSLEGGLKVRLDLINMLVVTAGVGYYDRLWRNSVDIVFNLRAIEIDIGADFRSDDFARSWQGYGFGARVGIKLGW